MGAYFRAAGIVAGGPSTLVVGNNNRTDGSPFGWNRVLIYERYLELGIRACKPGSRQVVMKPSWWSSGWTVWSLSTIYGRSASGSNWNRV